MSTEAEIGNQFLAYCGARLEVLSSWADDCLSRLTQEQLWWRAGEAQNAVGNLVLHLCGNVHQRITSALGSGIPDTRDRDREFDARSTATPQELRQLLKGTVAEALVVLRQYPAARLLERARIPHYDRSVLENVLSVIEHFAQHTGQIIFITKQLTSQELDYYPHLKRKKTGS
jgi:uncharacterized damage-inducible protein DinB